MPDWLWQGLVLTGIGIGISELMEYLSKKHPTWKARLFNTLKNTAFLFIVFYVLTGRPIFDRRANQPAVDSDNIEANIKSWIVDSGLKVDTRYAEDSLFDMTVTLGDGTPINVTRFKIHDKFIALQSMLRVSPQDTVVLKKLAPEKLNVLNSSLEIELANFRTDFTIVGSPVQEMRVEKHIPISTLRSDDDFNRVLFDIDSALIGERGVFDKFIAEEKIAQKR